jgi:membrane protein involved in colicin uptake
MTRTFWPGRVLASFLLLAPVTANAADKESLTNRIEAPGGAGAGTISGGTFNIYNHDPEEIKRLADQLDRSEADRRAAEANANELAVQLNLRDVTTQTVVGFLRVLARQQDLKLEQVPEKLAEITASYMQMQQRLANLSPQDPQAADLAQQAAEASKAGRFEEADRLLAEAEARETAAIDQHRRKAAQLRAARGDQAPACRSGKPLRGGSGNAATGCGIHEGLLSYQGGRPAADLGHSGSRSDEFSRGARIC